MSNRAVEGLVQELRKVARERDEARAEVEDLRRQIAVWETRAANGVWVRNR